MNNTMTNPRQPVLYVMLLSVALLSGCAGLETMPSVARAGDTVVLAAGWKREFSRDQLTVSVTDAAGVITTYPPGDAAVRAVINLYPDPLSYIVAGTRTGSTDGGGASYGQVIDYGYTAYDPDWWQTTVYLDLPATMAPGAASVDLTSTTGESYHVPVEIVPGQGSPARFKAEILRNGLTSQQLHSMERRPSYTVQFSGISTFPAAIEVNLTHDPDESQGGVGRPLVVNPRGEMKNITWSDDGTTMRVLLMNAGDGTWNDPNYTAYSLKYYKFYITGGITGLQVTGVRAFDLEGNELAGIVASIGQ